MRAIDCPCGHRLDDEELFRLARDVCPICFNAKKLDEAQLVSNARLAGAIPLWEWIGDGATVFSY